MGWAVKNMMSRKRSGYEVPQPELWQGYTHIPRHYQERTGAHRPKVVMRYPHAVEPDRGDLGGGAPDTMNHTGALEIVDCRASCETGVCGAPGPIRVYRWV